MRSGRTDWPADAAQFRVANSVTGCLTTVWMTRNALRRVDMTGHLACVSRGSMEVWMLGSLRRCEDQRGGPALPFPLERSAPMSTFRIAPSSYAAPFLGLVLLALAPSVSARPLLGQSPASIRTEDLQAFQPRYHRARGRGRSHPRRRNLAGQSVHDLRGLRLGWPLEDREPGPHLDERFRHHGREHLRRCGDCPVGSPDRLRRNGGAEQPAEHVLGQRGLPLRRRGRQLAAPGTGGDPPYRAGGSASRQPGHRLGGGVRATSGGGPRSGAST